MDNDSRAGYRRRVYDAYVTGRNHPLAPSTIAGLRPRMPYLQAMVRHHFPPDRDASILDLGCGHGALLYAMREAGYRNGLGVDASPEQVAAAQALGISGVVQADIMQTLHDRSDASLDMVVAFDVIEHFSKEELLGFVDAVHRVLRPGGIWLLHVPNCEGPFGAFSRYNDFTHELAFSRFSLTQLLRTSGFASVSYYEDRPTPHGLVSSLRFVGWAVIRIALLAYVAIETGNWDPTAVFTQNMLVSAVRD